MNKMIAALLSLALFAPVFSGCAGASAHSGEERSSAPISNDKLRVVATNFPAYDFAREITGGHAELSILIKPGTESHSFEPSPTDILTIQNCDVFLYTGGENDAWVDTILASVDTEDKALFTMVECVQTVAEEDPFPAEEGEEGHNHEDDHDHESEERHEHGHIDEHVWTSPKNAALIVERFAEVLEEADPENKALYAENAAAYIEELRTLDQTFRDIVEQSSRNVIVFGDRFPFRYFADEYGLEYLAAFSGCSSQTEASISTMATLMDTVEARQLPYIYHIELSSKNIATAICEETGADMLLLHSCHNLTKAEFDSGATYLSLMAQNAENLRKGLN